MLETESKTTVTRSMVQAHMNQIKEKKGLPLGDEPETALDKFLKEQLIKQGYKGSFDSDSSSASKT